MGFDFFNQELNLFYIVSQVFALGATITSIWAFQQRKKIQLLNFTVIATSCSILHYLFLGAWAGIAIKTVGLARNTFAAYCEHKHRTSKIAPIVFVVLYIIAGMHAYSSPFSILPVVAASIYTVAIYVGNARKLRYVAIITAGLWLTYNISVLSIVGIISETAFITNDLIAIYRYRKSKKHKTKRRAGSKKK